MITAGHVIVFSQDPEADRAFFDKVLKYPHVDAGGGWLIFKLPPSELAVHPAEETDAGRVELYLQCDDLEGTMAELTGKHVRFTRPLTVQRWGRVTAFRLPGGGEVGLYQPSHPVAATL
ncbi:VOC family protein [Actinospica durhamensis]|uniref:VOC family protein n=1 Tax=Actinospica durhamensis TaxID=1508375 RepID=UPI001FE31F6A|nr:extradiol dioxygenase [Actinospica durhamensis]